MADPRNRPSRKPTFEPKDLQALLYSYGDAHPPLQSTIICLDEILTDFIVETCHYAALSASYSRRQKIKVDDFKFVLRSNELLLGRVLEQLWREKRMKDSRQAVNIDQLAGEALADVAMQAGVGEEVAKKGRGRGRGKRKREGGDLGGGGGKRVAS